MRHRGLGWLRGGTGLCFPAEALQSSDGAKPERMCQVFLYCRKGETSAPRPTRPLTPAPLQQGERGGINLVWLHVGCVGHGCRPSPQGPKGEGGPRSSG